MKSFESFGRFQVDHNNQDVWVTVKHMAQKEGTGSDEWACCPNVNAYCRWHCVCGQYVHYIDACTV